MRKFQLNPIVKEETTKERVYKEIKGAILRGELPSEQFFTELQLADMLHTSRTPVREAVMDLIKEGLIVSVPRKGLIVKKFTAIESEQIFLLRSMIETAVIRKITPTISEDQLILLESMCDHQEEAMNAGDNELFIQLDQEFHLNFQRFASYELFEQTLLNLHDLSKVTGLTAIRKPNRMQEVLQEHRGIIRYMRERNGEAASRSMHEHLRRTQESIKL